VVLKGAAIRRCLGYGPGSRQAYIKPAAAIPRSKTAAPTVLASGGVVVAPYASAASTVSQASARVTAAARSGVHRPSARENRGMAAVSQGLVAFANHHRQPPGPGVEVIETPRYRITLQPDYPIPGPNSVAWIRCRPEEAEGVIGEVRAIVAPRHLPMMWTLDPDTEPSDFPERLAAHDVFPELHSPEVQVMVLGIAAPLATPVIPGLELRDALADAETFRQADAVNAEAFRDSERDPAAQERRRANQLASGNRRVVLATVHGEPAGSAGLTLFPPDGAIINGGAVRPRFRGLGVYRAMVAARLAMAREAGVEGLTVWGGPMSAPILSRLGFQAVGWRRFYLDTSTA
jgi:GNAT superfamily N-acetyltransferase